MILFFVSCVLSAAWLVFCVVMSVSSRARNQFCDFFDEGDKMPSIFGINHPTTPGAKALQVPGITNPHFTRVNGSSEYTGSVHDSHTNQVYELRQVRFGWIVLDEWCVEHFGITLRHAILKARSANRRTWYA